MSIQDALSQLVRVMPDRYSPEYSGLLAVKEREVPVDKWGVSIPFIEALNTVWSTPAECQLISIPGLSAGDSYPRVGRKWALNLWSGESDSAIMPGTSLVVLDLDHGNKGKSDWATRAKAGLDEADTAFMALIQRLRDRHGFGWYLTNSGARLFGVSPRYLDLSIYEDYLTRLLVSLARNGFPVGAPDAALLGVTDPYGHHIDPACYDLGRLHKLPQVPGVSGARSGLKWIEATVLKHIDFNPESCVAWSFGGKGVASALVSDSAPPVPERLKKSEYTPLKTLWCYDLLVTPQPIGKPGARHDPALKISGAVAGKLGTSDAARVYQIVLPALRASIGSGDDEAALMKELWQIAQYVCAGQSEVLAQKARISFERSGIRKDALARLAALNNCDQAEARSRIVLSNATGNAFVFDEASNNYASRIYDLRSGIGLALRYHCPNLVALQSDTGAYLSERHLSMTYATPAIDKVRFVYGLDSSSYDSVTQTIELRAARLSPHFAPVYNDRVNVWLKTMSGVHYADMLDWLHFFPDLQRPLCALYLQAEQGIGKNVFAQGLAAMFDANAVPYKVASDDFRVQLITSPLLHVDESVPLSQFNGSQNSTSLFRQMVGSKSHDINIKGKDPIELRGCPRLLITANTADALKIRENLTPEDLGAIQIRVGFIEIDSKPARAFIESISLAEIEQMMNIDFPQHVLWLATNHIPQASKTSGVHRRFASWSSPVFATTVKLEIGKAKKVAEAVARWFLRNPSADPDSGIFAHDGLIFVNLTALTRVWEGVMSKSIRLPESDELVSALRVLAPEDCEQPNKPIRLPKRRDTIRAWRVDPLKLAAVARMLDLDDTAFGDRLSIREVSEAEDVG